MGMVEWIAVAGAALVAIAFLFTDSKHLRLLASVGAALLFLYFALAGGPQQWPGMAASFLVIAANLWMLYRVAQDRQHFKLTAEQMMLFARLPGLSPGQFKQLLEHATWQEPTQPLRLTDLGQRPDRLYYVLEGTVEVEKSGKVFALGPHAFVGELAFLREKPATATVTAKPGALLVAWKSTDLRELFKAQPAIEKALSAILSADMAEKIARADVPLLQEQSTHQ